jgi:fructokinase
VAANMTTPDPLAAPDRSAAIVGIRLVVLDVIVSAQPGAPTRCRAGGTCGNVLAALAYLGWTSYPIARLGDDPAGRALANDLARWGVRLDMLEFRAGGKTPIIVQRNRRAADGEVAHSFSRRCPGCRAILPWYRPATLASARRLRLPVPRVFFFDLYSPAALMLAEAAAAGGALILFEPPGLGDPATFARALAVADVLKFSRERLPDLAGRWPLDEPRLVVETLGRDGLRYRDRRSGAAGEWRHLDATPVGVVGDSAGCGDWCTAGLLHSVGQFGRAGFERLAAQRVEEGLRLGQALAAWNCAFEGARGGMYAVDREQFAGVVRNVLAGAAPEAPPVSWAELSSPGAAPFYCARCRENTG